MSHDDDPFDQGFGHDLAELRAQQQRLRGRRAVLGMLGVGGAGLGAVMLNGGDATARTILAGSSSAATCSVDEIPSETAGPYPGDGSNGPDVLLEDGVVRKDIRSSFGDASGRAKGVPFKLTLTLQDTDTCRPLKGLAVYAWHCTRDGLYSMYSNGVQDQNFLRGVQVSGKKGKLTFASIFPGCYSGRWPHIHFEVYRNKKAATSSGQILVTSQVALPRKPCAHVYANATGYESSATNLNRISLGSDNVFGDGGGVHQLATVTGSIEKGYHAKLVVPVDL